ncbi:MAG TPA: serine/threonine-protein kinase [Polyangia bacterium]|nr:serine/threonine-protein kinase [Polyangia bacterium]
MSGPDPLVGKTLADRFEILERIGEGGTGVVYRAKQLSVDRTIAIKVLGAHVSTDPSWVKRFHNEARAASRLDHPNTVRLIDFGQTKEGLLFIAMEFLSGRSLRTEIERLGRLPPNRVLRIVSQMCASLSEAHNQGIIHRDIKPDNVYLVDMKGAGDYVKVLDFSVAKLDAPDAQVTRAGVVFGTPQYMSPEQGRGVPLDARSDIYAVGVVAYEMLTGKPPFDAKIPTEVVMMHLRDRPAPLQGLPPQLTTIVMKALEKDAASRQQSAEALDAECQQCLAELFPRQTPGPGAMPIVSAAPPMAPARPVVAEQKTMMAQEAPVVRAPVVAEQKTMMAQEAPRIAAPPPGGEQKTMMAQEAPKLGVMAPPPAAAPPPAYKPGGAAGYGAPPAAPPPANAEQKTMMAMEAPRIAGGLAPPPAAPPPPSAAPPQQKTMMAQEAPLSAQKTMLAQPAPQVAGGSTKILPDSAGVVAYAAERAQKARLSGQNQIVQAPPAGALFWIAWIVVGIGAGLGIHFFMMQKG